jgi:hypothetical protein
MPIMRLPSLLRFTLPNRHVGSVVLKEEAWTGTVLCYGCVCLFRVVGLDWIGLD